MEHPQSVLLNQEIVWKLDILKNDGVRQWVSDDIPYMENRNMFETTNQDLNMYVISME